MGCALILWDEVSKFSENMVNLLFYFYTSNIGEGIELMSSGTLINFLTT